MNSRSGSTKRRAACDECRFRKVKCSGGEPCRNCQNDRAPCTYSNSRPVGRQRKRPRAAGEDDFTVQDTTTTSAADASFNLGDVFSLDSLLGSPDFMVTETPVVSISSDASTFQSGTMPVTAPCSCLSLAYLTITRLQFPAAANDLSSSLADLQSAQASAVIILKCSQCPTQIVTAMQNLYQLSTLLVSIVGRMQTILAQVDSGVQVYAGGQAGGQQDTSMFSILFQRQYCEAMSEHQFRLFFRKMLKDTILGSPTDTSDSTLLGIVHQFEGRQKEWHEEPRMYAEQAKMFGKRTATDCAHECRSRTLFQTYKFLNVDVLSNLSIDQVIANLKQTTNLKKDDEFLVMNAWHAIQLFSSCT